MTPVTPKYTEAPKDVTDKLCTVITHLMERNTDSAPGTTPFHTTARPSISIRDYVIRMRDYMYCSAESYIIASVLITRLEEILGQTVVTKSSVHRLLLTACVVAAKSHDDVFLDNRHYSEVGGITLEEMNKLELFLLQTLNFNAFVSPDQYELCLTSLESLCTMLTTPHTATVIEQAARMDRRTSVVDMVVEDVLANAPISCRRSSSVETLESFAFRQRRSSMVDV